MVNSLQALVLYSVPIAILFDMLKILHHLPMGHECFCALFRRCTHEELRDWSKTLPWDHPITRKLDHEVHRRHMAGESYFCFFPWPTAWVSLFPLFLDSTKSAVACPPVSLPSTSQTKLGRAVLGSNLFVLIFV